MIRRLKAICGGDRAPDPRWSEPASDHWQLDRNHPSHLWPIALVNECPKQGGGRRSLSDRVWVLSRVILLLEPARIRCARDHPAVEVRRTVAPPDRSALAKCYLSAIHGRACFGNTGRIVVTQRNAHRAPALHQLTYKQGATFFGQ